MPTRFRQSLPIACTIVMALVLRAGPDFGRTPARPKKNAVKNAA
jgi:hypothetical protein